MFEGIMSKIRPRTAQELRDGETSGEKLKTRTPERAGKEDASPKTGKCKKCGAVLSAEVVKKNLFICPECGGYFRLRAYRRILMLADTGSFTEWDKTMPVQNPLDFPDYEEKILEAQEETGLNEAVVTGRMKIEGIPCAIGVCDARYLMSSMGHNMGEKIARLAERAEEEKLPLIIFSCSGGARMQEGIISLMQMVKTSEAIGRLQASGQLFISFLTDPTMGGVTASFAMLGDMILAEPGALIGFTGQRVIQQTIGGTLPEGFQKAEFQLEHGFIDRIVRPIRLPRSARQFSATRTPPGSSTCSEIRGMKTGMRQRRKQLPRTAADAPPGRRSVFRETKTAPAPWTTSTRCSRISWNCTETAASEMTGQWWAVSLPSTGHR